MMKVYKLLNENGDTPQGYGHWGSYLPVGRKAGKWLPAIEGKLIACENGYHLLRFKDLLALSGPVLWECEYRGGLVKADDQVVVRQARPIRQVATWSDRTLRLFAADCAARALNLVENPDPRSVSAVEVARKFAVGEANSDELAAAWDAARGAAWGAAWAAARDAAWAAAWGAAWAAEREWQLKRLRRYLFGKGEPKPIAVTGK